MTAERAPRTVVVQAEGFPEPDPPRLPVGVTRWPGPPPRLAIFVKATFQRSGGELQWARVQKPLFRGEPSDFVFRKGGADVLMTGHAFPNEPPQSIGEFTELLPDALLVLEGVTRDQSRTGIQLPGLAPQVTVTRGAVPDEEVIMRCDTLWITTGLELLSLVWRGDVDVSEEAGDVSLILVSVERSGAERAPDDRLAAMQRGRFVFAERASDPEGGEVQVSDEERARITLARYQTWASKAPPPRMPLAEYVRLAALLAEQPAWRAATLAQHDLDEDRFTIEERAWLEKMAREAGDGDVTLADEYSRLYAEAQEEVATPVDLDLAAYAELRVHLDDADDPAAVLRDRGISIPQWMRIDRRWTDRAEADAAVEAEIEQQIAAARARRAGTEGATS
jgi:hypothetical protein